MPTDRNVINKINSSLLDKIKSRQKNIDNDFFHNKLLNNIIEINYFENDLISLSNCNRKKEKSKSQNSPIKKLNSAIMNKKKLEENDYISRPIKSNNIFNKRKSNSFLLNNDIHNKIQNRTNNEENKLKSTIYYFPDNIKSIKKNSNLFHRINKSQTKEDEKCNKMSKYVNILERKMKEKLMKITNFDDVNCCYQNIDIKNYPKKSIKNANRIFLDINKIYKLNKFNKNDENSQKSNILTSKTNRNPQNSKNSSMIKTLCDQEIYKNNNLDKLSQYIKEEVKKFFIKNNFSSIKDYFNDWLLPKNKNNIKTKMYLDTENIYLYLKRRIGLNIPKEDINILFGNTHAYLDLESFKNYFFEENSGKEYFIITKDLLLTKSKFDFENKNNKDNFGLLSPISFNSKNKEIDFNLKYNILFNALKDQKALILDKICENMMNNNIEYEYNDFNNLINSLNINKKILEQKIIKSIFIKYQNKNKKLNIKYFINILYGNENINKECLFEEKECNEKESNEKESLEKESIENNKNEEMHKVNNIKSNNYESKKNYFIVNKNIHNKKLNINIIKKENKPTPNKINNNNNQININKNTEGSSDHIDIVIKSKKKFFKNKFEKSKKLKNNVGSPPSNLKNNFNKSVGGSSHINKQTKIFEPKNARKHNKKIFDFHEKNIKEHNINNITSNKEKIISKDKEIKEKKLSTNSKKYSLKIKKQKLFKFSNFKTIKIFKKSKKYKENEISKNDNNDNEDTHFKRKRPLSSNIKRKRKIIKNNNYSKIMNFVIPKIFEESRVQYLNSDIIDLI